MSEIFIPQDSFLDKPHKIEDPSTESKLSFFDLAKSRVQMLPEEEYCRFEQEVFGDTHPKNTGMFVLSSRTEQRLLPFLPRKKTPKEFVDALDIKVNQDAFIVDELDYSDLVPYTIEHEVYEAWVSSKVGYQPKDGQTSHLLARRKQFEAAMADGKAERLLEFCVKFNPANSEEFQAAYDNALKKKRD